MKKYMLIAAVLLAASVEATRVRFENDEDGQRKERRAQREEKKEHQRRMQALEEAQKELHIAGSKADRDRRRAENKERRRAAHNQDRREAGYHTDARDRRERSGRWHTGHKAGYREMGAHARMVEPTHRGSQRHPHSGRYQYQFDN